MISSSTKNSRSRRDVVRSLVLIPLILQLPLPLPLPRIPLPLQHLYKIHPANAVETGNDDESTVPVFKTPSGLKYIDLIPGNADSSTGSPSPAYGDLCSIAYTAYIKLPKNNLQYSTQLQQYDRSTNGYIVKHGNGKMIPGLDEGLHTMRVGMTRRIIIPPKLGFVDSGLGPIPDVPWNRNKLNQLLDQMIALKGGTIIYEVTLLSVIHDEADLGYYTDASISPEDFATLRENLRIKGNEGRIQEQVEDMAQNTIKGQDRLL
jgi:FKBP-type peptidyl-prolyl cis-trans isomerase